MSLFFLLAACAAFLMPAAASACPSCSEAVAASQEGFSRGIGVAIVFLLAVVYGLAALVIALMVAGGRRPAASSAAGTEPR